MPRTSHSSRSSHGWCSSIYKYLKFDVYFVCIISHVGREQWLGREKYIMRNSSFPKSNEGQNMLDRHGGNKP